MSVVLITGCSSGFGRAAALAFAARGDEAVHPAAGRRALADREDVRVGGAALLVYEYAAPLRRVQPGVAVFSSQRTLLDADQSQTPANGVTTTL